MQNNVKQNYPGLVASYDTWLGNEVGLFYNAPEPTLRQKSQCSNNTKSKYDIDKI